MKRRTRIVYTDAQKAEMWDRWQSGETMHDIARSFDRYHTSVQRILTENGGIRPRQRKPPGSAPCDPSPASWPHGLNWLG